MSPSSTTNGSLLNSSSLSDDDVDATGGGGDAESTLKDIQNMIEDYFTEDEDVDDADADDAPEDVEGDEEEEADLEELANNGVGKAAKTSSGPNAGYGNAKSSKGDGKLHEVKKILAKGTIKSNARKKKIKPNASKVSAIMENRIQHKNFWVMNSENHFYSLLYHALVHKPQVSETYRRTLPVLSKNIVEGLHFIVLP